MENIEYRQLTASDFAAGALDGFVRTQQVHWCWRWWQGRLVLEEHPFVDDWKEEQRRLVERLGREAAGRGWAYGAFCQGELAGFALLDCRPRGSSGQYRELHMLHVSQPYRRLGIGSRLFCMACQGARQAGGQKLYLSAHSARETQAFYRRLGCVEAQEPQPDLVAEEPFGIQMEYVL